MENSIFTEALLLPPVPLYNAAKYQENMGKMTQLVDEELANNPEIFKLIGYNNLELMYANHGYHVRYMNTIFHLNAYDLLASIIIWVYRSYHLRGFSYEYFIVELSAWQRATCSNLTPEAAVEINLVYQWMIDHHDDFISLAESPDYKTLPILTSHQEISNHFLEAMLSNDNKACLELAVAYVHSADSLSDFYVDVLYPCLYEVGRLWEEGEISASQEHLATAIVTRVMSVMYGPFVLGSKTKGKAVMMTAPGEEHDVGARMTADLLEMDGWQVDYLDSQSQIFHIQEFLREAKPYVLGISIAMPFNIEMARRLIEDIKKDCSLQSIKVMIGGQAFASSTELWQKTGADGYCVDSRRAVELAAEWWKELDINESK